MENTFNIPGGLNRSTELMHQDWATTAYWANFIAIVNYILLGLGAFALILLSAFASQLPGVYDSMDNPIAYYMLAGGGALSIVIGLVFLGLALVINTFLFRFARRLKTALDLHDQDAFETAWFNFRNYLRWNGISILVLIVGYIVLIVAMASALSGLREF
ncbi:MAG: hypothetical protein RMJ33_10860 [Saprospiraceae bacterium]|nr:hypothetical protein [Saprospiraceae bacterium]MDW8230328.1 hypothetical protein [Saprospiraceae bacterium]